jgi:hypothetical protein
MARRSVLRFAALLAALAFLLPLAAIADSCADCLWAVSPDCCPPSCCPCCVHGPSVLTASIWGAVHPQTIDIAPNPHQDPSPSSPPRDIFHVPKPSLV